MSFKIGGAYAFTLAQTVLRERNVCHAAAAAPKLEVMWLVRWIIENKDFFLAISALMSPFAAVFVGLKAANRQAKAVIESTTLQVRSASLREVRQRSWEKLRDECAAEIYAIAELKKQMEVPDADNGKALRLIADGMEARMVRISLLISAESRNVYNDWFTREGMLGIELMNRNRGEKFGRPEQDRFEHEVNEMALLAKKILDIEESRAAGI